MELSQSDLGKRRIEGGACWVLDAARLSAAQRQG
jgi:hypothetical protein